MKNGSGTHDLPDLHYAVVSFKLMLDDARKAPQLTAAAVRGAFGNRLRRLCCVTGQPTCAGCTVAAWCPYHDVFETPNTGTAGRLRNVEHVPHPFVIRTPEIQDARAIVEFTLIGSGLRHLPLVVETLKAMSRGCTDAQVKFTIEGITARDPNGGDVKLFTSGGRLPVFRLSQIEACVPSDNINLIDVEFLSPAILVAGQPIRRLDWRVFVERLLSRIDVLSSIWCGSSLSSEARAEAREAAAGARIVRDETEFVSSERRSSRQDRNLPLDGLIGSWSVAGNLRVLLPYLIAAQHVGVGKSTSAGCGEMAIRAFHGNASPPQSSRVTGSRNTIDAGGNSSA